MHIKIHAPIAVPLEWSGVLRHRFTKRIEPEAVRLIGDLERESGEREKKGNSKGRGKP